ncbi:MAG: ferritin [Fimbriimonadaceae bacterium]|jgi:ferritin|nr:ferritin [Fimbriimonadaceae bacterium]
MISAKLAEMLTKQIGSELTAHQQYMAISLWFHRQSLDRWAALFRSQSLEEAQHASKIMQFLLDVDVEFDLPAIAPASTRFENAMAAVEAAQRSEARVSGEFKAMAQAAIAEGDTTAFQFLQWFIAEQVEEESKMSKIKDLVASGINLFQAEALLDSFDEE